MDRISGRSLAARLFGASPARTLALLQAAWPLAVGPELARRTEVLGMEGGTLRVRVPDMSWRKVLHRIQPQILGRLRDLAGELAPRRMGFVDGGIATTASPDSAVTTAPPPDPAPSISSLHHLSAIIPDPEIRARFAATAARYLARSKGRDDA
jgi:Dna[CI] antecedent DciA-like protein